VFVYNEMITKRKSSLTALKGGVIVEACTGHREEGKMVITTATDRQLEVLRFALSIASDSYYAEKKGYTEELEDMMATLKKLEVNA